MCVTSICTREETMIFANLAMFMCCFALCRMAVVMSLMTITRMRRVGGRRPQRHGD